MIWECVGWNPGQWECGDRVIMQHVLCLLWGILVHQWQWRWWAWWQCIVLTGVGDDGNMFYFTGVGEDGNMFIFSGIGDDGNMFISSQELEPMALYFVVRLEFQWTATFNVSTIVVDYWSNIEIPVTTPNVMVLPCRQWLGVKRTLMGNRMNFRFQFQFPFLSLSLAVLMNGRWESGMILLYEIKWMLY